MAEMTAPRRWKLPSELSEEERVASRRIGGASKVERPAYRRWRTRMLKADGDNLGLRLRLLREESEDRHRRAGAAKTAALEAASAADWDAHAKAKRAGAEVALDDGGAAALEAEADEFDAQAAEIEQFLAETKEIA